jgi:hypothetical protein
MVPHAGVLKPDGLRAAISKHEETNNTPRRSHRGTPSARGRVLPAIRGVRGRSRFRRARRNVRREPKLPEFGRLSKLIQSAEHSTGRLQSTRHVHPAGNIESAKHIESTGNVQPTGRLEPAARTCHFDRPFGRQRPPGIHGRQSGWAPSGRAGNSVGHADAGRQCQCRAGNHAEQHTGRDASRHASTASHRDSVGHARRDAGSQSQRQSDAELDRPRKNCSHPAPRGRGCI